MDTLLPLIVGSLITWLVTHQYYTKAANDLLAESKELCNLHRITPEALEQAEFVALNRDSSGNIVGMAKNLSASLSTTASIKAKGDIVTTESGTD